MKDETTNKYMKTYLLDKGEKIPRRDGDREHVPVECYVKPDGAYGDLPSVAFIAECFGSRVLIQVSKKTLCDMFRLLGLEER